MAVDGSLLQSSHDQVDWVTGDIGHERIDSHVSDDHNDPPRAALEDIDPDQKITKPTWAAAFFLDFTFQPSLGFTVFAVFPILLFIKIELQGASFNVNWMASGWSLTSSNAFSITGQTGDYFGVGMCSCLVKHFSSRAKSTNVPRNLSTKVSQR